MTEDQIAIAGKGTDHMSGTLVVDMVITPPQGFTVDGNQRQAIVGPQPELLAVLAKDAFQGLDIEAPYDIAHRRVRRHPTPAQLKQLRKPIAMKLHKTVDLTI